MANELILIVEDNDKNMKLARDVLQVKGYRTIEAESAEAGLPLAAAQKPDLVLMDIHLPGMNGIDALKKLRASPDTSGIPVLAFTASVMPQDRREIMGAGFDGFVSKPINLKEFIAVIAKAVQKNSGSRRDVTRKAKILVVDDTPANVKLLADLLTVKGYDVVTAANGEDGLKRLASERPDLVLLDVMMPGMNGYDVCRAIRADAANGILPVVMVTSLDPTQERIKGLDAGADDFLTKPINQPELLARVRSLLRIKDLYDQLGALNASLEQRVAEQVKEIERFGRLKRFVSPRIGELILAGDVDDPLQTHRRDITVVFTDLRGFTVFSETAEPEEAMDVLRAYHGEIGRVVMAHEGTIEHFAGDGVMILFNDPIPVAAHELAAIRMALEMRDKVGALGAGWKKRGYELGFGVGIANGYATLGAIGFEERRDYGAIGPVTNLSARLCSEAKAGQVLISQRVFGKVEEQVQVEPVGELSLRGFQRAVTAYNVTAVRE